MGIGSRETVIGFYYEGKKLCGTGICQTCGENKQADKMHSKKECSSCYSKKYRKNNKKYLLSQRHRRNTPEGKIKAKEYKNKYYSNPEKKEKRRIYKLEKRRSTPGSRKGENQFRERTIRYQKIAKMYKKQTVNFFKNCPEGFQVDHIVPILHKNVCGLHVPWNLQYLTPVENNMKNNHWDGTMENKGWKNVR